jgi:hypothetical protein
MLRVNRKHLPSSSRKKEIINNAFPGNLGTSVVGTSLLPNRYRFLLAVFRAFFGLSVCFLVLLLFVLSLFVFVVIDWLDLLCVLMGAHKGLGSWYLPHSCF